MPIPHVYPFTRGWTFVLFFSFGLLWVKFLWALKDRIWQPVFISLGSISINGIVSWQGSVSLKEITKCFPMWIHYFGFPLAMYERASCSTSCQNFELMVLPICMYSIKTDAEYCSPYILFGKVCIPVFYLLFIWFCYCGWVVRYLIFLT